MENVSTSLVTLGQVYTQLMSWIGTVVSTIAEEPLLLLPVGIFITGAVIGLAKRFIGR